MTIDPTCAMHGERASEHECLFCAICFATLTPDTCAVDTHGQKWDVCPGQCAREAGVA